MKNKYFTPAAVQKRIEEKIERYRNAIDDEDFKKTLDQMPINAETLATIEAELETVVADMPGESSHEKWFNFQQGINLIIGTNVEDRKKATKAVEELIEQENSNLDEK